MVSFNRNRATLIIAMNSTESLFQIVKTKSGNDTTFLMVSEVSCHTERKGKNLSPGETAKKF